jgi:hypothetical protein
MGLVGSAIIASRLAAASCTAGILDAGQQHKSQSSSAGSYVAAVVRRDSSQSTRLQPAHCLAEKSLKPKHQSTHLIRAVATMLGCTEC